MGVHGLWRLIEPSGKPVPLETLENKVLAIDVSIWLHQAIKGFQDSKGAPIPNAHLLGIYHRVCKLLYFKIKPVFVFDGGVPVLKKQTIAKRNELKSKHLSEAGNIQRQLLSTLLKHSAVNKVLSESTKAALPIPKSKPSSSKSQDDLFILPPSQLDSTISSSGEEEFSSSFTTSDSSPTKHWDLYKIDVKSAQFKALPADIRHEILTELKDTRKQNSWGRLHELPTQTDEFSGYQMERLLKRFSVQNAMEEAEKEMGGHSLSLGELEALLNDHGVITGEMGKRLASDENTRFLYIKDVKKALEKAKEEEILKKNAAEEVLEVIPEENEDLEHDREFQRDLQKAIVLSLQNEASTSKNCETSCISNDVGPEIVVGKANQAFSAARNYMMEYTGLTPKGIDEIFAGKGNKTEEKQGPKIALEDILEETEQILKDQEVSNLKDVKNDRKDESFEVSNLSNDDCKVKIDNLDGSAEELKLPSDQIIAKNDENDLKINNQNESSAEIKLSEDSLVKTNNKNESPAEIKSLEENSVVKTDSIISINDTLDLSNDSVDDSSKVVKKVTFANEEVEIMSDSSDSEGFVEVSDSEKGKNKIEIVINPNEQLEDDLFGDIFEDKSENVGLPKPNLSKLKDLINNKHVEVEEISIFEEKKALTEENLTKTSKEEVKGTSMEEGKIEGKQVSNEEPLKEEKKIEVKKISNEELKQMGSQLETESRELISERSNKERLAGNITDQMYQEAQELLRLFGVPYIIAPMEAEAQCAFLNEIDLTDGTITDDSDIWLFGGKIVYKNFFNQSKHVTEFRSESIEHHFKLSRNQLILLALLVGSDYTIGIQGVGPVTALEILAAFPPSKTNDTLSYPQLISGLTDFKNWFKNGKIAGPGKATLRTKLKNLEFTGNFPNLSVLKAYLEPQVETSREKFSWGKPNAVALTDYAKEKFGWTHKKAQEILNPVLQRLQESKAQTSIRDYFKTKHKLASDDLTDKLSKRVKKAITKIAKEKTDSSDEEDKPPKKTRKTKIQTEDNKLPKKPKKITKAKPDKPLNLSSDEDVKVLKSTKKVSSEKIEEGVAKEIDAGPKVRFVRENIPQKLRDKSEMLRNKLKAIEVFRKSKEGPGFVKRRGRVVRQPKEDAELSESSDSN